jgi:hypothetical protein
MWTIIIVIVVIVLLISVFASQQQNNEVAKANISQGGMRKSFPVLTNHLENFYGMTFVNDTGRNFSYAKQLKDTNNNTGTLSIGVKLDMTNTPMLFSKYQSSFRGEFEGMPVTGVDFDNAESIDKCINISLDKLRTQGVIEYENTKSKLTNRSASSAFISDWESFRKELLDTHLAGSIDVFINRFFVPDMIDRQKFMENLDILHNTWKAAKPDYGTKSVKDIFYLPPAFDSMFVAGYPDVYQWYQENAQSGRVEIHNKISQMDDEDVEEYMSNPQQMLEFYRSLVSQFKRENQKLECGA